MTARSSYGRTGHTDRVLRWLCGGLICGVVFSGLLFAALDLDLQRGLGLGVPCPFHAVTGVVCPGCGMTRALLLVGQLEWNAALRMNPLVFLLLGMAALRLATSRTPRPPRTPGTAARQGRWTERLAVPALGLVLLHWINRVVT